MPSIICGECEQCRCGNFSVCERSNRKSGKAPWCATGVEIKGSAVADVARTFADVWSATGEHLTTSDTSIRDALPQAGDVRLRVVPALPSSTGLYRLDQ